jgi:hypothetical protein
MPAGLVPPRPTKCSSPHRRAPGRKRLKLRPWATRDHQWAVRRLTDCVTKISDFLLAGLVGDGSGFAGLVHLLVTHGSFAIPQTSLGGFGM